ncbi:MAG TPA: substrate-binding domain-containing protein [Leptolyngbyaceae cyanobacterium]
MNTQRKTTLLLLALTTTLAVFLGDTLRGWNPTSAQQPSKPIPTFTPPVSLAEGTRLNIDGSPNMAVINQALEQGFEGRYPGSDITLNSNGSEAALQALLSGNLELAAVGRSLTDAEQAQGLTQVPISREKIAIIVGQDNPFRGDITSEDFARIFRGQITNWSQLGGPNVPIRFIDHPDNSDIRQALSEYEIFKKEAFQNGRNVVRVETDDTAAIVRELGADGLSYAISSQVVNQENVRVLTMHGTLPEDPRYPYSQPRGYVYRGEPSIPVEAFLGFATNPDGQKAVAQAKADEAATVATAELLPGLLAVSPDGQIIVRGTQDGVLEWYDGQGNPRGVSTQAHSGLITGLVFTPDGQSVVSSGSDGTVRRWDLQGNPLGAPLQGSDGPVTTLAVSPDGSQIVSGNNDGTIQKWAADGTPLGNPIQAHQGAVRAIAFGPGQILLTGSSDASIRLWNRDGGAISQAANVHKGGVTALAASEAGQFAVSGGEDGTLRFWDANGQPKGNPIPAHTAAITALAASPDGQAIASAGQDNQFRLWDPQGNPKTAKANTLEGPVSGLAYKPNGDLVTGLETGGPQVRTPQGDPRAAGVPDLSSPNFNLPPEITSALDSLPPSARWIAPGIVALLVLGGLLWSLFGGRHTPRPTETEDPIPEPLPVPSANGRTVPLDPPVQSPGEEPSIPLQNTSEGTSLPPESSWVSLPAETTQDLSLGGKLVQAKADLGEGTRLAQEGRYDDAFSTFNNAIEAAEVERMKAIATGASLASITVVLAQALARRGGVLAVLGRTDTALDSYNRALETDSNSVEAWVGKGRLLSSMGRADEALFCFDKALELDANAGPAWAGKGRVLIQLGRQQEGQTCLNKAAELGGDGEPAAPVPGGSDPEVLGEAEPAVPLSPYASSFYDANASALSPAPSDADADAIATPPTVEEDVPLGLQDAALKLPSAVEEIQPTVPLAGPEVPQHLQTVVIELPDDPEIPEHAFISSSEIVNPDAMDLPTPAALGAIAPEPQAPSQAQPQPIVDPINPLDVSLPAPEDLDVMTEALQASVDLSTMVPAAMAASVEVAAPSSVDLHPGLDSRITPDLPDVEPPSQAEAGVPAVAAAALTVVAPPPEPATVEPAAKTLDPAKTLDSNVELESRITPDIPDADAVGMAEQADVRPDNPDGANDLSDLPPEVLAALSSIPADSPDSLGIKPTPPATPVAVPPPAQAVTPPPVPANPRLAQPSKVQTPTDATETLTGSWITLSVMNEEDRLYTVWEISDWERTAAKRKGGDLLAVRLYDVTDKPSSNQLPAPVDEQECYELARDWYVTLPKRDRTYIAEIGYKTAAGEWLSLARSSALAVAAG